MKNLPSIICTALFCVSALPALAASSSDNHPQRDGGRHHTPPAEAIAACKGLSAQDVCQFNGRDNELVAGVCDTPRAAKSDAEATLICRPNRAPKNKPEAEEQPSN